MRFYEIEISRTITVKPVTSQPTNPFMQIAVAVDDESSDPLRNSPGPLTNRITSPSPLLRA